MLQAVFFAQGAEAAIVSARVLLLIGFLHFSYHIACHIVRASAERYATLHFIPYHAALRIHSGYLVQSVRHILFQQDNESYRICTYRDKKGDVIGKAMASEAINRKNEYINTVIRITVTSHGMLFLLPRPQCSILEKRQNGYINGELLIVWRNSGTRC